MSRLPYWQEIARDREYRRRLGQIQTIMGSYYLWVDEDLPKAFEALEEALLIAGEEMDVVTLVLASFWLGLMQAWDGNFEESNESFQRALDINVAANNLWGIAAVKAHLSYFYYFWSGQINSFMDLSSEALRMAQESGDPYSRGITYAAYGTACYAKGLLADAESHLLEGRNLTERIGNYSWTGAACSNLAGTYFEMKEYEKSRESFVQAGSFLRRLRLVPSWVRLAELVFNCVN